MPTRTMWTCSNLVLNSADDLSAEDLFTEDIVYKKLCMLNVSKSPGPDNIHPHLLKKIVLICLLFH